MSWFAQAMHMLRKEVMHARYALLLFIGLVALSVAHTYGLAEGSFDVLMFVLVLFAMVLVAFVVQADSPVRTDAMWGSRPLDASAVLASKVAFLAALVVVGVAGQVIGLGAYGLPASRVTALAWQTVVPFASLLYVALVVAAFTRDLPRFAVTLVVLAVSIILIAGVLAERNSMPASIRTVAWAAAWAVRLWMLMMLYRWRALAPKVRVVAGVIFLLALLSMGTDGRLERDGTGAPMPGVTFSVRLADSATQAVNRGLAVVYESSCAQPECRLTLIDGEVVVQLRDGTSFKAPVFPRQDLNGLTSVQRLNTSLNLLPDQEQRLRVGVTGLSVNAMLRVETPERLATIPIERGAALRSGGRQFRLAAVPGDGATEELHMNVATVGRSESAQWDRLDEDALQTSS